MISRRVPEVKLPALAGSPVNCQTTEGSSGPNGSSHWEASPNVVRISILGPSSERSEIS